MNFMKIKFTKVKIVDNRKLSWVAAFCLRFFSRIGNKSIIYQLKTLLINVVGEWNGLFLDSAINLLFVHIPEMGHKHFIFGKSSCFVCANVISSSHCLTSL